MTNRSANFSGPDICRLEAHEVVKMLKAKDISPAELLDASYQRIEQVEPLVNAMPTLCKDRAYDAAKELSSATLERDAPGFLAGLPTGIKDLAAVAGVKMTMGTVGMADNVPKENGAIVDILEQRGAIVVGKTNTPEFGAGGNTFNDVFGKTLNPWDTSKNAGGSSGGAAVSLATGEVWLSHGSDLAGSLRTPAAYCGVVGLRPSPGRASGGAEILGFNTEGVQGPMARGVLDCALFLDAMSGFQPQCPLSLEAPAQPFFEAANRPAENYKIAYAGSLNGFAHISPRMDAALKTALELVSKNGGEVEEDCPDLPGLEKTFRTLRAMLWAALPGRAPDAIQKHYKPTLAKNIQQGRDLTVDDIYDAQLQRSKLFDTMHGFLGKYDVLACPTIGVESGPVEIEYPIMDNSDAHEDYISWLRYSFLSTATGLPSISIPVGFFDNGMPVGLQLIGRPRGEAALLSIARAIELVMGGPMKPIDPISKS